MSKKENIDGYTFEYNSENKFEENKEILLTTVCAAQILLDGVDQLEEMGLWSNKLKFHGNRFKKELNQHIERTLTMWYEIDEEFTQAFIRSLENALTGIVNEDPIDIIQKFHGKN